MNALRAIYAMWSREMVRFLRQRSRVAGAVGTPIILWALMGTGLASSFRAPGSEAGALEFFLPGAVAMILLFTAIFATITVVQDRREGFLQGALASPAPRWALVMGQSMGATTLAVLQGALLLLLAGPAGVPITMKAAAVTVLVSFPVAFGLTNIGLLLAWRMESTEGFHAILNLVLMPMWFLSGAVFPLGGAPGWLAWMMRVNPATYGVELLREALGVGRPEFQPDWPGRWVSLGVTVAFGLVTLWMAARSAKGARV